MDDGPNALSPAIFDQHPAVVAEALIGTTLLVSGVGGIIVETEAYDAGDSASHSYRGPTVRNAAMFGPPACAYVYRIYGLHWCLNVTCGAPGGAVLIRALEPTRNIDDMIARRHMSNPRLLCAGPGRLAQALGVDGSLNGASLYRPPFALIAGDRPAVQSGPRIGISTGVDTPWRFVSVTSPYLSRPAGAARTGS